MKGYQDSFLRELIVDFFAGGGGASIGIELATGRTVDIAVNHDPDAIAMHKVNHPFTRHYQEDVFAIDPEKTTNGRPVGIMWASPDCKHFSKAKGGAPVEKKIRGLSWVVLLWAMSSVSPRCIFMENVEEIQTWGPLKLIGYSDDGKPKYKPDLERAGETFKGFMAMLTTGIDKAHPAFAEACEFLKIAQDSVQADRLAKGLGYKAEWKVLKACDYGAPTIRKRFYMVARRDGLPIVWPEPTHGKKEGLKPYRTAAECIDWSIPCPSIFDRKRALAVNTQRRIARGLDKFVIKNPQPFIMQIGQTGRGSNRVSEAEEPLKTICTKNEHCFVAPKVQPYIMSNNTNNAQHSTKEPLPTVTTGNRNFVCSPSIIQYHSEQSEKEVRGQKVNEPIMTVDGSPRYGINACYISKYYSGEQQKGADIDEPLPAVTAIDHNAVVAVNLSVRHGNGFDGRGSKIDEPSLEATNHEHIMAANIVHYYGGADHASKADGPLPTVTTKPRHYLTESHLCVLRNNMGCKSMREPLPTLTTSAGHMAQIVTYIQKLDSTQDLKNWHKVRKLLNDYAGYSLAEDEILIIEIDGIQHFIADIGMRMLKAKELKLAQGFPEDYVIDIEPYIGKKYNETKQIARLGNAVCPPVATALIRANCADMAYKKPLKTVKELEVAMCG